MAEMAAKLLGGEKLVDCTHTIDEDALSFCAHFKLIDGKRFVLDGEFDTRKKDGTGGTGFRKCVYRMPCDVGTHIDAPIHWYVGKRDISELTLEELTAKGAVIDCTLKVEKDADYALTVLDITEFEDKYGKIPPKSLVVMKTGWSKRGITNIKEYVNADDAGTPHFPGFSPEAAKFLVEDRDIVGIGIDTASLDPGIAGEFPVHNIVLGSDRYQIENMVLEEIPEGLSAKFVSLPLKVKGGPEAETRVMAILS